MINKIILGAGFYGFYAALFCAKKGESVLVLEYDSTSFARATYINQARVHNGYHYPRSLATAIKSRGYFERFNRDYGFCVKSDFEQIYATSAVHSWTDAAQFRRFCENAGIPCDEEPPEKYFVPGLCDSAFRTTEYAYDAQLLRKHLCSELAGYPGVVIRFGALVASIAKKGDLYSVSLESGEIYESPFVLNATYASVNQIHSLLGLEPFRIKYELCEIILCDVSDNFQDKGFTVMDGPFFSIMPFGKTGKHSLTSVTFTPHSASYSEWPVFDCQERSGGYCSPERLGNCNECPAKPESAWPYMSTLARKYLKKEYQFEYNSSLFSMKPILSTSEVDDSRPTIIRKYTSSPDFVSVFSGKINTVYDLNEVLS
jgi:hypothetical protein